MREAGFYNCSYVAGYRDVFYSHISEIFYVYIFKKISRKVFGEESPLNVVVCNGFIFLCLVELGSFQQLSVSSV